MRKIVIAAATAVIIAGGWTDGATGSPASAVTLTSAQHAIVRQLPGWVHWRYASRAESRDCSTRARQAIVLWTTGGTSNSVLCPDGTSFSS